ncbi:uncharacterized protein KY384_008139 [Bacidia gigantensis]|uniref:uncharacterized protein n=1 Tax=Bacidia gigantensis TaxID=2732470 RepID=UPI001D05256E|nr:uncharacterized protein KY384_008139 [Bacidia gigantensis]KAG8526710.1 hypothetical protein KY384_008139 [Bacidia gigantensis]
MDPFSADGELLNIHTSFLRGAYSSVISFDLTPLSASSKSAAKILQYRARLASGEASSVLSELKSSTDDEASAVKALALYTSEKQEEALAAAEELAENEDAAGNATVQLLGGIVLYGSGKVEEALALAEKHEGSLEVVALIVQIHLQQNRVDLAIKEVQAARKWAQDSLLVNIAESWVGLRVGGDRYQSAFYVFEEMAQAPDASGSKSLVSQAVCEMHLGRLDEAKAALDDALQRDENDADAIANSIVWEILSGNSGKGEDGRLKERLGELGVLGEGGGRHPMLVDLEEKESLFDMAAGKYQAKVAS